ncbi:hypothetical protein BASA50_006563 [Batrachochytrium salamandrivorans]|uniref:Cyclic nucleotide-binding domain-containing protein n=1 Tax=Batrachochytrium salamandrivorans TaxID=1357716 RepID=A0ABQ8F9T1_9FUNG|nr:hypothetical protein BASA60_004140 [Batrachochytrium salamandrivorans]KAH6594614.1 hypothetical protein BASA50_006563 [Batrachochytrium salamandrivorans]KAH9270944.1 hypothetical protein BASA83_006900 [Batrachochytrium salamandrivorans]
MKVSTPTVGSSHVFKKLWPDLSDDNIGILTAKMEAIDYDGGEVIFNEGDETDQFFIIMEGSADMFKAVGKGALAVDKTHAAVSQQGHNELVKLITLSPGDVAGESALFENEPMGATLIAAAGGVQMMRISVLTFRQILRTNESINTALLKSISRELRNFRISLGQALHVVDEASITMSVFDFKQHEAASFECAIEQFRQSRTINVKYLSVKLTDETVSLAAGSQIVCVFVNDIVNADILTRLAAFGIKCIALRCAGFNNVDLKVARALGMQVVRVPAYSPYAVAEHAVCLILALNRKIVYSHSRVKQGNFSLTGLSGFDLHGKTIGVIGTGKIGQCFIKIMLGFGCEVLCYDVYRNDEILSWGNVRYVDSLDELYQKSKIISLHCPLMPSTKYIINAESLKKMTRDVMIINTSRGPLVNTKDLIDGLKSGHVGYAGLDVYEEESAYFFEDLSDHVMTDDILARLMTFNNVIITSHQAFLTAEALEAIAQTTMSNVAEILDGKTDSSLTNSVPM